MILIDILPYVFLLFLTLFLPAVSKKYVWILFVVLLVFSGFRYGVGWDYFNYTVAVEEGGWRISRVEFLIRQLELFCYRQKTPQLFFFVTSLATLSCYFFVFSKVSFKPSASIFAFLCLPIFFLSSLSIIRFALAVAITFLAYYFLEQGRRSLYFALLVASFFVHRAAAFALLTMPFLFWKVSFNQRVNVIIFIASFVIGKVVGSFSLVSAVLDPILDMVQTEDVNYVGYLVDSKGAGFSRTPYLYAAINIIVLASYNQLVRTSNNERMASLITLFSLGCSFMFLFSFNQTFASRMSQFFMVYFLLIIPYFKEKSIKNYMLISIFLFVFFFQLTTIGYHPDFIGRINCFLPYRMFFGQ